MKKSIENRLVRLETLITEWGKDAEIKKLNERIEDQSLTIKTLQQKLIYEQESKVRAQIYKMQDDAEKRLKNEKT